MKPRRWWGVDGTRAGVRRRMFPFGLVPWFLSRETLNDPRQNPKPLATLTLAAKAVGVGYPGPITSDQNRREVLVVRGKESAEEP